METPRRLADPRETYHPAYDLVHAAPALLASAVHAIQPERIPEADRAFLAEHGISPDELNATMAALIDGTVAYTTDPDVASYADALQTSGFLATRPVVQRQVLATFARQILGFMVYGIRERTELGKEPYQARALRALVREAAREAGAFSAPNTPAAEI